MRRVLGCVLALSLALVACSGKSTSPTSPSTTGGTTPSPAGPGPSAGSATITGAVQGALPSAVAVVGTTLSAAVDSAGRFALAHVPSGDVQLQLSGGGASATLPVSAVQPSQSIDLVVAVSGSTATIDSQFRSGGGAQSELEGRVEALPPTTAPLSFKAAGRLVKTDSSTQFRASGAPRSFADLQIGMRVEVTGTPSGDAIAATEVDLQNSPPPPPPPPPVELSGLVSNLSGTASAFQFMVNGTLVKGDATTALGGDDKPATFADLKNGVHVEVKGTQQTGFVQATRIQIDMPVVTTVEVDGLVSNLSGTASAFQFMVNSTLVKGDATTALSGGDDKPATFADLKNGVHVEVKGTQQTGFVQATRIQIQIESGKVEGAVSGLTGTCPSLTFVVNGVSITTNGSTKFEDTACTALKNGDKVQVTGTKQAGGSLLATQVEKDD